MAFIPGSSDLRHVAAALEDMLQLGSHATVDELQTAFRSRVREEVATLADRMRAADAFDLIELMRLHEVPIAPVLGLDPAFEGSGAALEMIAIILTSRASRLATDPERPDAPNPHELIPGLHDAAMRLLRQPAMVMLATARRSDEPLAMHAAEYRGNLVNVRTMQYSHLQDELNVALFASDRMNGVLEVALGLSCEQFVEARDAIASLYSDRFMARRYEIGDAFEKYGGEPAAIPEDVAQRLSKAMTEMMFLPGERAQFTAAELAERTECDQSVLERVLDVFSVGFTQQDAADAVLDFLRGENRFRTGGLVADGQGNYLIAGNPIGTDALRYIVEDALKDGPNWDRYDRARTAVSESLANEMVEKLLQTKPRFKGLKYYAAKEGVDLALLGPGCTELTDVADETESDGFFVVDDVALCVEVKGRSVADQARRGGVRRLARELSKIVGSASSQARRLETLIKTNGGIWMADRTWLDLQFLREVRSVAVCLDDLGPLAIAMDDLRRAEVLKDDKLPWITSLHDLSVLAEVLARPAEFLLYVRQRSDSGVAKLYRATDELDLFMLFMAGHLYVEPDPDQVARDHPMTPKPTKAARRRFKHSQQLTRVGTYTDALDSWMYREEGSNPFEAEKPVFNANPLVLSIVDELTKLRPAGWLRISAELLAASGESQGNLERAVKSVLRSTQIDHQPHSAMHAFAGVWGFPVVIAGSCPIGTPVAQAIADLEMYMRAKKHQLQSDRAICILFDEAGSICDVRYDNQPPRDDPDLDRLVEQLQLKPPTRRRPSSRSEHRARKPKAARGGRNQRKTRH
jgi:hypothetical protein